jgi:beta-1,4-mannooligosaccharide/beta-1,4-mannosyl-N-acetylglucosamine phosphorylase
MTAAGPIYRVGAVLLDLEDPSRVIKRSASPILSPREDYERIGDVPNVCFASGAVVDPDGTMKVYYGAADTSICIALGTVEQVLAESFD